jgi:hypothetical protein
MGYQEVLTLLKDFISFSGEWPSVYWLYAVQMHIRWNYDLVIVLDMMV